MKISLIAVALLCLFSTISFAQEEQQTKRSEFGISLGFNVSDASVKTPDFSELGGTLKSIKSKSRPGFSLGILYRYRLNNLLVLRAQSILSFTEVDFNYDYTTISDFRRKREMVNLEFPLYLVFEKTYEKVAPSFFIGGRYRYDIAAEEYDLPPGVELDNEVFRKDDILVDVGFGLAFKMARFTFKPELTYSRGLLDQTGALALGFDSIHMNQFGLRFSFYGS